METKEALKKYCLRLADSSLIMGQRMAEWCSKGPTLEEDIALTNISLDLFGQARILFDYVTSLDEQNITEDDLAFKRNEREYYNRLITELPNGHFGDTVARGFMFSAYAVPLYRALQNSKDDTLAAFGEKSLKEVIYHLRHYGEWMIRLGKGTDLSKIKIQKAVEDVWSYTGDLFDKAEWDSILEEQGISINLDEVKKEWKKTVDEVINRAELSLPENNYMHSGSNACIHTEHLGHILGDMQFMQRAYPNQEW